MAKRLAATVVVATQDLGWRESQSSGSARVTLRWLYCDGSRRAERVGYRLRQDAEGRERFLKCDAGRHPRARQTVHCFKPKPREPARDEKPATHGHASVETTHIFTHDMHSPGLGMCRPPDASSHAAPESM